MHARPYGKGMSDEESRRTMWEAMAAERRDAEAVRREGEERRAADVLDAARRTAAEEDTRRRAEDARREGLEGRLRTMIEDDQRQTYTEESRRASVETELRRLVTEARGLLRTSTRPIDLESMNPVPALTFSERHALPPVPPLPSPLSSLLSCPLLSPLSSLLSPLSFLLPPLPLLSALSSLHSPPDLG